MWTLEVYNRSGSLMADLTGHALSRTISQQRNTFDVIDLTFDLDDITTYCTGIGTTWDTIFAVDENEIRIKKGDTVMSAGQIVYARPTATSDSRRLQIKAYGWFYLLGFRYTAANVIYTATDTGAIAWGLINTTQIQSNGDMGITQGVIQTSQNVNRQYSYKNVKDAIVELSQIIDGFDFEITWDKQFNVYWPKMGATRTDIAFDYPGNIIEISFERDGTKLINRSLAVGSGSGVNAARTIAEDVPSEQRFYLRERTDIVSDLGEVAALQQKADANVLLLKSFLDIPSITVNGSADPQFGTYRLGDVVPVQSTYSAFQVINGLFRIDAISITLDENNYESVKLIMLK